MAFTLKNRRTRWAAIMVVAVAALIFGTVTSAQADTSAVSQAQKDSQTLQQLVDKLSNDLSQLDENYNYADQQLQDTQSKVKKATKDLATAKSQLTSSQGQLESTMVSIYKRGDSEAFDVLLSSENFSDLISRAENLQRLSQQDADVVQQYTSYAKKVQNTQTQLTAQLKQQRADAAKTAAARTKVEQQLALQKQLLKGKEAQVAQLQAEEVAHQAALAAAYRQAQVAEATTTTATRTSTESDSGTTHSTTTTTAHESTGGGGSTYSGKGSTVVSIAMKYLGVRYVWAGSSPSGFDCSGFAMYVYEQVGVSLPHSSGMQYNCGTHVSRSELQPGDLVFFYSPIHHVGIYIGNGQMINARGACVQIDSLWSSYVGATRILS